MTDRHSIIGISGDGRRTTLCVNVGTEAEAERLAASLRTVGDYLQVEVVVDKVLEQPAPWVPPPIDVAQVVQRRKEIARQRSRKSAVIPPDPASTAEIILPRTQSEFEKERVDFPASRPGTPAES